MCENISIVITSIASSDNKILQKFATESIHRGYHFFVIGDDGSPLDFNLSGCDFYSIKRQKRLKFEFAKICPQKNYARKNIGYLLAMERHSSIIVETDDDNLPYDTFWKKRERFNHVPIVSYAGWVNVYKYFSEMHIWPRGFPLEFVGSKALPAWNALVPNYVNCPIQQGLSDENPDVDAIYRLILPLPIKFKKERKVALSAGSWCPFNSQTTSWWRDAFPLMYLPSYCSFRMTDIWRSFVAQRIAWVNEWRILFHEPTVSQKRNIHNLMKDFQDEIPGYIHNVNICNVLQELKLSPGVDQMSNNMKICYKKLVEMGLVDSKELILLDAWNNDLKLLH